MTTQIIQAFAKVGIKMTKTERVWHYLKDKPGSTAKQIAAGLNTKHIASPLHLLINAGLATAVDSGSRLARSGPNVKCYYAKGAEYTNDGLYVKPAKTKKKKKGSITINGQPIAFAPQPAPQPAPADVTGPTLLGRRKSDNTTEVFKFDLETMTIAEARQLYTQLKKMFGN